MQNNNWGSGTLHTSLKKVHSKPIISVSPLDHNMFFTSSEDNTLRLWDIRLHSSVKLFRNPVLSKLTNCQNDNKNTLFVGAGQLVYSFDIRRQQIFVESILARSEQQHFDELSIIKVNQYDGMVGAGDDQGDIRLYNYDLECVQLLDQGHSNIVNSIQFVKNDKEHLCLTGGFDSRLLHWQVGEGKVIRQIDLQEILKKNQIKMTTPPFIYSIHCHKHTVYVATQGGHMFAFPVKDLKKPKYILEASLSRIVQAKVPQFNQNIVITLSFYDGTFSLFDHTKRVQGGPMFIHKYSCMQHPTWIEFMGSQIIVSSFQSSQLSFLSIK